MARHLSKLLIFAFITAILFSSGCSSTSDKQESEFADKKVEEAEGIVEPPTDNEVMKSLNEDEYMKTQRLQRSKYEKHCYLQLMKKANTVDEMNQIKLEVDRLEGEIESLEDEIETDRMLRANQERFAIKHFTVFGPIGIACKILEITLNRLFILFIF